MIVNPSYNHWHVLSYSILHCLTLQGGASFIIFFYYRRVAMHCQVILLLASISAEWCMILLCRTLNIINPLLDRNHDEFDKIFKNMLYFIIFGNKGLKVQN